MSGFTSYFSSHKTINAEWEDDSITKIELTADDLVWNPTSSEFADQEAATMKYIGGLTTSEDTARGKRFINSVGTCDDAADITYDASFGLALENEVAVSRVRV